MPLLCEIERGLFYTTLSAAAADSDLKHLPAQYQARHHRRRSQARVEARLSGPRLRGASSGPMPCSSAVAPGNESGGPPLPAAGDAMRLAARHALRRVAAQRDQRAQGSPHFVKPTMFGRRHGLARHGPSIVAPETRLGSDGTHFGHHAPRQAGVWEDRCPASADAALPQAVYGLAASRAARLVRAAWNFTPASKSAGRSPVVCGINKSALATAHGVSDRRLDLGEEDVARPAEASPVSASRGSSRFRVAGLHGGDAHALTKRRIEAADGIGDRKQALSGTSVVRSK